jgi:DNA-directed RNA polymerase alpha subunit
MRCERNPEFKDAKPEAVQENPELYLINTTGIPNSLIRVLASDLKWIPQGMQAEMFAKIQAVHPKIVIAKLRENQEIHIEIQCEKGIGKQHAKW